MKNMIALGLLLGFTAPVHANLTAYQALEHLQEMQGNRALENIVAIRAFDASPVPTEWIISRREGSRFIPAELISATGPLRHGDVALAMREIPLHAEVLRLRMLNMDSDAALRIAKKKLGGFAYKSVDYTLFMVPLAGTPVWIVSFYNPKKQRMARVTLSATTGASLRPVEFLIFKVDASSPTASLVTFQEPFHERAWRSIGRWFSRTATIFAQDSLRALSTTEEIIIGERSRDDATTPP